MRLRHIYLSVNLSVFWSVLLITYDVSTVSVWFYCYIYFLFRQHFIEITPGQAGHCWWEIFYRIGALAEGISGLIDWSFAHLIVPVVTTTTSVMLSSNKIAEWRHSGTGLPRLSQKMALK